MERQTQVVPVPGLPTGLVEYVPADVDVRAIRTKLKMSQNAFAARFGILPSTLRDWEENRRHPDGAARVLLMVIDKEPDAVTRALAPA